MEDILVSICCITYNHAPYIRQCLEGFLMQKCEFDFEILINDDASTDGTSDIIREYQKKYPDIIKPIIQTENQYSKGARGINIRYNFPRSKGKYIALCEGDDYWTDPLKLQKQIDYMEANENISLTCGGYDVIDTNGNLIESIIDGDDSKENEGFLFSLNDTSKRWLTKILTTVFRKSMFFYENIDFSKFKNFRDTHLIFFLLKMGNGFYFRNILGRYRIHSGGVNSEIPIESKYKIAFETSKELYLYEPSLFNTEIYLRKSGRLFLWNLKKLHNYKTTLSLFFTIPILMVKILFLKIGYIYK